MMMMMMCWRHGRVLCAVWRILQQLAAGTRSAACRMGVTDCRVQSTAVVSVCVLVSNCTYYFRFHLIDLLCAG